MRNLYIKGNKHSLDVTCDGGLGILVLKGASYPDNSVEFYEPTFKWTKEYIFKTRKPIQVDLKLQYIDTSSTKCIFDLLEILETYLEKGGEIRINWYYEEDDDDMFETGEEFAEDTDLTFNMISCDKII